MNKNFLLQVRLSPEEVKKLDYIVKNRPGLLKRTRSHFIVGFINSHYKEVFDYKEKKKKEDHKKYLDFVATKE